MITTLFATATPTRLGSLLFAVAVAAFAPDAGAQWIQLQSGTNASFRGMSVVNQDVAWISGTGGTFKSTSDGGKTWQGGTVPGAESFDFRAVQAFSLDTAILMVSAQDTGLIYRTTDRGRTWNVQYRNAAKGVFLDGMAFFDSHHGFAVGDPMDGRFVILETRDGGQHWARIPDSSLPPSLPGDGAFAASGTSLVTCGPKDIWLGTGGAVVARVYHSSDAGQNWTVVATPISAGVASAGIFSLACRDAKHLIAVGGNYSKPDPSRVTVAVSDDGGATWLAAKPDSAIAFLSGVSYLHSLATPGGVLAVGTEGSAFSTDFGRTWKRMDRLSLNAIRPRGDGSALAAGGRGRVVVIDRLPPG
jgi:photosystem II stability/assembly factor-like uncharacterized protein